jgi:hypothetical protein
MCRAREYGDFVQTRLGAFRMLLIYHPTPSRSFSTRN